MACKTELRRYPNLVKLRKLLGDVIGSFIEKNEVTEYKERKAMTDHSDDVNVLHEVEDGFYIMKFAVKEVWRNEKHKVRKCVLRNGSTNESTGVRSKTILLVGQTGSGKTTLLDGIFNYVMGVSWEDKRRLTIANLTPQELEQQKCGQASSQTEWITAYTIPADEGTRLPYDLVVVDTPGFGSTKGVKEDKRIVSQMKYFFENIKNHGIDSVNGVCFIVQASLARLTPAQKYIFQEILAMFSKDIEENIFPLFTFSDGRKPVVIESIKQENIPYKKCLKFNNSALFVNPTPSKSMEKDDSDDETDVVLEKIHWDIGMSSFEKYFEIIEEAEPRSLVLSAEVLRKRDELNCNLQFIVQSVKETTTKMARFKQEREEIEKHDEQLKRNEDFEIEVIQESTERVETEKDGMNCTVCSVTCDFPCRVPSNKLKYLCFTFNIIGKCRNCSCRVSDHELGKYRYKFVTKRVKKTLQEIKERYMQAEKHKVDGRNILQMIQQDYNNTKREVKASVERARSCLEKLREISLRPSPLSCDDYIDMLIHAEYSEAKEGFQERILAFLELKEIADMTKKVEEGTDIL